MRARKVLLLLAILLFGASVETAWRAREHLGFGPTGWRILRGEFHGPSHSFEVEEVRDQQRTRLRIENEFGAVRVRTGEPGELRARLTRRVYLADEARAAAFAERIALRWSETADEARLGTNRRQLAGESRGDVGFETDLEVAVPPELSVRIESRHGDVAAEGVSAVTAATTNGTLAVSGISGAVDLRNRDGALHVADVAGSVTLRTRHGAVSLERVAGAVDAYVHHGDVTGRELGSLELQLRDGSLTAEGVSGELTLRGSHAGATLNDVDGPIEVRTSYAAVSIDGAGSDVSVESRHGRVEAKRASGAVTVKLRDADLELEDVAGRAVVEVRDGAVLARELRGGARIEAHDREVEIRSFGGPLEVKSGRARVHLTPGTALADPVQIETETDAIELFVPAGSAFDLSAQAAHGRVEVALPGFEASASSRSAVEGRVGDGGPSVSLKSRRGDVRVLPADSPEG